MPSEVVEQLLDAGPKCSSFHFHVVFRTADSEQRRTAPPNLFVCTTVIWPMMKEAADVMFSGKSAYVRRRLMEIEAITALNHLLVCELTCDAEC